MATKALRGMLEGFYHSLQGLSFSFFECDGITILVSSCLPLEVFHKIIGVVWCGYIDGVVLAVFTMQALTEGSQLKDVDNSSILGSLGMIRIADNFSAENRN